MKVLIVNGSPRGRFSVTLQSCLYLEKCFPQHDFDYLNVGAAIQSFEKDMTPALKAMVASDIIIFAYPVYTFLVPSQLHRFMELLKKNRAALKNKFVSQFSTSKHFFDVTAHRFMEDNFRDMGMRVIKGLSADMEDMLSQQGQKELRGFMEYCLFCVEKSVYDKAEPYIPDPLPDYSRSLSPVKKQDKFDTVIVADLSPGDTNLRDMIKDFDASFPYRTRFINLAEFNFKGGCLGCLNCAVTGKCVYKDGFDEFLRENILTADAIVYAFTLQDHSMGSLFKMYDDRQFCNGHRTVAEGKPFAYICRGDMKNEENLKTVLEARTQVNRGFLAGIATDAPSISAMSKRLSYALEQDYVPPRGFYGVGGMKIFRDLIWLMRGMMPADHKFYKAHGLYDFPQKKRMKMILMSILGAMMRKPFIRSHLGNRFNEGMLAPYKKEIDKLH
ncbi:MAG: NAD(P)H-dependent oxidoreductase [Oscillospiraceae bacterium]|nr:NAD(P)H-dependent oxidoreductase [Oscillospiraceae bacterium]